MGIESKQDTVARLREQCGREPTEDEIQAARKELIRKAYAAMAVTDLLLRDEAEDLKPKRES